MIMWASFECVLQPTNAWADDVKAPKFPPSMTLALQMSQKNHS